MDKQLLAEAVAALLPEKTTHHIDTVLRLGKASRELLAFECHKEFWLYTDFTCDLITGADGIEYEYGGRWIGVGDTHEDAIFAAVLDWFEKGGAG